MYECRLSNKFQIKSTCSADTISWESPLKSSHNNRGIFHSCATRVIYVKGFTFFHMEALFCLLCSCDTCRSLKNSVETKVPFAVKYALFVCAKYKEKKRVF